jgi:Leucine-rich repeat (LRR) protein
MLNLRKLYISYCNTGNILVNNLKNLKDFEFRGNSITDIDLSNLTNLKDLASANNPLTSLNISNLINLISLKCYGNNLTSLDLTPFPNLILLQCGNNPLNTLDLGQLNLWLLDCSSTNISSLNLSNSTDLSHLTCSYNNLTNLNLNNNINLQDIDCSNNLLSTLDFTANTSLTSLKCNNNNLSTLYIKNGITETILDFSNNPNLMFICADVQQGLSVQNQLNTLGMTATVSNSYCFFTPGGNYNTITGSMIFDANNNGCDALDLPQSNIRININDGTNTGATFTNNQGAYNFYTQTGSFVLTPAIENPTWFTFFPSSATIPFANNNNNTTTQNFCIVANGVHNDLEVIVSPINPARPGFDATYKIVYKNKGNQTLSGNVNFTYNDAVLDFVSATIAPNSQNTGVLNWSYANLLPFENRSFYVTLHVNAPTATPPVSIGDVLSFNASITPMITDENPLDNSFTYNQTVVGSFDPNNITCLEGDIVPPSTIGSYLHYGVNFENTGTYPAENIVVKVVIDTAKYDINSLQMLNTSNPAYTKITGNVVEFIFKNIMLDTGGHGNVLFKVKTNNNLVNGDIVSKRADIFFDYNAPINTGMVNTTFQLLNNGQFVLDNSIIVSPNPTSSIISINGNSSINSVQVYDVQGRLLETKLIDDAKATINISDKTSGIYFLKITTDNGIKVEKIVKE